MAAPIYFGRWINIHPVGVKFPYLCKLYQEKFSEPIDDTVFAFPYDVSADEFIKKITEAIEKGEKPLSIYCIICHYHEEGKVFNKGVLCPQCGYTNH